MAKENIYDEVMKGVLDRIEGVSDLIAKDFKNTKPFDKEEIPRSKLADAYMSLTRLEEQELIRKHGQKAIDLLNDLGGV